MFTVVSCPFLHKTAVGTERSLEADRRGSLLSYRHPSSQWEHARQHFISTAATYSPLRVVIACSSPDPEYQEELAPVTDLSF